MSEDNRRPELPFVLINGAVSVDGKLALENRSLIQFSSRRDQKFVLQMRATVDAVLCGADTVETFSLDLGSDSVACRIKRKRTGRPAEPLRVLLSDDGDINPDARIFQNRLSPIIVLTTARAKKRCIVRLRQVATVKTFGRRSVNLIRALHWLHKKFAVKRLLCEGGGETNAALIAADVVNEIHVTLCPLVLRGRSAPTLCDGTGAVSLKDSSRLKLKAVKRVNGELFLTYGVLARRKRTSPPA